MEHQSSSSNGGLLTIPLDSTRLISSYVSRPKLYDNTRKRKRKETLIPTSRSRCVPSPVAVWRKTERIRERKKGRKPAYYILLSDEGALFGLAHLPSWPSGLLQ